MSDFRQKWTLKQFLKNIDFLKYVNLFCLIFRVMMGAFPMYIPDNPVKKVVVDKDKEKDEERVPLLKK